MKSLTIRKAPGLSESYRLRPCSGMLKKYGRFVPVVLGVSLLLCSCSAEGTPTNNDYGESVPLSIQDLHLDSELATRVAPGAVTADGATIGIFLTNAGGYTPIYNRTYTCSGGKWSSTDPIYVDKRTGKALAVYDPNGLVSFGANSTITTNTLQAQVYDEAKLWYYDNTTGANVNSTNAALAFKMKCAYSWIVLSIQRHATNYVAGNCAITNVNLKSGTVFYSNNSIDISTAALQGNATTGGWSYNPNIASIAAGATDKTCSVLIPPQAVTAGLTITLTIDGADRAITVPAIKFNNSLAAGTQYTIELIITDAEIVLPASAVTVNDRGGVANQDTDGSF